MSVKVCDRCGVALTPGLGGRPHRLTVMADNGHMTSVDLCREHYEHATRATLEALLGPTRIPEWAADRV